MCAPIREALLSRVAHSFTTIVRKLFYVSYSVEEENKNQSNRFMRSCVAAAVTSTLLLLVSTTMMCTVSNGALSALGSRQNTNDTQDILRATRFKSLNSFNELYSTIDPRLSCLMKQGYPNFATRRCYKVFFSHSIPFLVREWQFCNEKSMTQFYPLDLAEISVMDRVLKQFTGTDDPPAIELGYGLHIIAGNSFRYISVDGAVSINEKSNMWGSKVTGQRFACQYRSKMYDCTFSYANRKELFVCFETMQFDLNL